MLQILPCGVTRAEQPKHRHYLPFVYVRSPPQCIRVSMYVSFVSVYLCIFVSLVAAAVVVVCEFQSRLKQTEAAAARSGRRIRRGDISQIRTYLATTSISKSWAPWF